MIEAAGPYLDRLPERLVYDREAEPLLGELGGPLPEEGSGTQAAVEALLRVGTATATASAGPRFFHFVIGGSTPAALAADWVVSMLDQNAFVRASSRFADAAETVTLDWLRQLVGLPPGWGGALTASATFANVTGLALAAHWWAERQGVDLTSAGLAGLPRMPVLSSGYVHPSARKALQLLGHGKDTVEVFARDDVGRIDLAAVRRRLGELGGPRRAGRHRRRAQRGRVRPARRPGRPGRRVRRLAARRRRVRPVRRPLPPHRPPHRGHRARRLDRRRRPQVAQRAVRERVRARPRPRPPRPGVRHARRGLPARPRRPPRRRLLGPESSRRAAPSRSGRPSPPTANATASWSSATATWPPTSRRRRRRPRPGTPGRGPSTSPASGYHPPGRSEPELDDLNRRLGESLLDDGRVFAGATVYGGRVALRPAISNWRTTADDLDLFVKVVRELGAAADVG